MRYTIGSRSLLCGELSRLTVFAAKTISLFEEITYFCTELMIPLKGIQKEIQEHQVAVMEHMSGSRSSTLLYFSLYSHQILKHRKQPMLQLSQNLIEKMKKYVHKRD